MLRRKITVIFFRVTFLALLAACNVTSEIKEAHRNRLALAVYSMPSALHRHHPDEEQARGKRRVSIGKRKRTSSIRLLLCANAQPGDRGKRKKINNETAPTKEPAKGGKTENEGEARTEERIRFRGRCRKTGSDAMEDVGKEETKEYGAPKRPQTIAQPAAKTAGAAESKRVQAEQTTARAQFASRADCGALVGWVEEPRLYYYFFPPFFFFY